jgi:hypothetical protein
MVWSTFLKQGLAQIPMSAADFADIRDQNHVFEQLASLSWTGPTSTSPGMASRSGFTPSRFRRNCFRCWECGPQSAEIF